MTGLRVHTEHGVFEYPEAEFYTNDKHSLDIKDEDCKYLATFNHGQWLHVEWLGDAAKGAEPRVWQDWDSLNAARRTAERHTTVKNPDGVTWTLYTAEDAEYGIDRPEWLWSTTEATTSTLRLRVGPFVEILEGK